MIDKETQEVGEALLKALLLPPNASRETVCCACGYMPPWVVADMYTTYGLPIVMSADFARGKGLRMDWRMVEFELEMRGCENAAPLVAEAKRECELV